MHPRRDNWDKDSQFDEIQQLVYEIEQLRSLLTPQYGEWTAVIRGSTLAGVYELSLQNCSYVKVGKQVTLNFFLVAAAVVTGGGTGYMQITGVPFPKVAERLPMGSVYTSGVNFTTSGANLSLAFTDVAESSILYINESADNVPADGVPISGFASGSSIGGSITYETDE